MFRRFYLDDPFNKLNNRSMKNTKRNTFNCGGYALGTFSWYCPHNPEDEKFDSWYGRCYDYGFENREEAWTKTMYAVSKMVLDFEGKLRMITDLSQLQKSERVVAFRLSSDGDFHYIKKCSNGRWQHKCGSSFPIHQMTQYEVFNTEWCGRYDGPVILLAIKK
jgi:hypothetical protein